MAKWYARAVVLSDEADEIVEKGEEVTVLSRKVPYFARPGWKFRLEARKHKKVMEKALGPLSRLKFSVNFN